MSHHYAMDSKFSGTAGHIRVKPAEGIAGLEFTVTEWSDSEVEVTLDKDETLRLHAALGTYIFREGLAL